MQQRTEQSKLFWSGEMGFHQPLERWGGAGRPGWGWQAGSVPRASLTATRSITGPHSTLEPFMSHVLGSTAK